MQDKLKAAAAFLRTPKTAADLADHMDVSRPTAYAYLRAVKARKVAEVRQGTKGPRAATFQVAP